MTKPVIPKYRPVLSAEQINYIIHLARLENPISNLSLSILSTLAPFQAKIENAGITAAYAVTPKTSMLEKLGGPVNCPSSNSKTCTKEEIWAKAYAKYKLQPETCSVQEIYDAKEHMYLNDLMSPEELAEFEASQGNVSLTINTMESL